MIRYEERRSAAGPQVVGWDSVPTGSGRDGVPTYEDFSEEQTTV